MKVAWACIVWTARGELDWFAFASSSHFSRFMSLFRYARMAGFGSEWRGGSAVGFFGAVVGLG